MTKDRTTTPLFSLMTNYYCVMAYHQNDEVKLKEVEPEEKK